MASRTEGTAVSDKMRYTVKPTAVRSENIMAAIKPINGNTFNNCGSSTCIQFVIPAYSGGYYMDSANCRLNFGIQLDSLAMSTNYPVVLDRSPHSVIRRIFITDNNNNVLEDIDRYDALNAMIDLCTGDPGTRNNFGKFNGLTTPKISKTSTTSIISTYVPENPTGGQLLYFPVASQLDTPFDFQQTSDKLTATNTIWNFSIVLSSSVFGGGSDKYLPCSAMAGLRINIWLNNAIDAFLVLTYDSSNIQEPGVESATSQAYPFNNARLKQTNTVTTLQYNICDPTFYLATVRVDPQVDRALIDQGRGADGKIRIHTTGWQLFNYAVKKEDFFTSQVIPITVSSLKAIYWTFTPGSANYGYGSTSFYTRFPTSYQVTIGTTNIPSSPVTFPKDNSFGESFLELMRAWHVRPNDQGWPTNLTPGMYKHSFIDPSNTAAQNTALTGYYQPFSNCVYGCELETFSQKGNTIESGANTLNNTVILTMNYDSGKYLGGTADNTKIGDMTLRVYCSFDMFLVLDPTTGIITKEF